MICGTRSSILTKKGREQNLILMIDDVCGVRSLKIDLTFQNWCSFLLNFLWYK